MLYFSLGQVTLHIQEGILPLLVVSIFVRSGLLAFECGVIGSELGGKILEPSVAPLAGLAAVILHGDVLIRPGKRLAVHREGSYWLCASDDDICAGVI